MAGWNALSSLSVLSDIYRTLFSALVSDQLIEIDRHKAEIDPSIVLPQEAIELIDDGQDPDIFVERFIAVSIASAPPFFEGSRSKH